MTIDNKIRVQCDINKEAVKISALSSGKIDVFEYFTGEEILPFNRREITEKAKYAYSPLGKAFQKQTETIEEQGRKQIDAITNQNKRLSALKNKDDHREDHKDIYKKVFDIIVKEKFDE